MAGTETIKRETLDMPNTGRWHGAHGVSELSRGLAGLRGHHTNLAVALSLKSHHLRVPRAVAFNLIRGLFLFLTIWAVAAGPSSGQEAQVPEEEVVTNAEPSEDTEFIASVVVDGETLFKVRGGSALPATERAEEIVRRIVELAQLPPDVTIDFSIERHEFGLVILANGRYISAVTEADAEYEQLEIGVLAALHEDAIKQVIERYRENRTADARVESALSAFGWTVAFIIATALFVKRRKRLVAAVERFAVRRVSGVEQATSSVVQSEAIARLVGFFVLVLLWIIYLFILYYYLSLVLLAFAETRPVAQLLLTYVSEPLIVVIRGIFGYIPNLITIAIIFAVARYLIRAVRLFADNVEAGTFELKNFEPHWIKPTFNLARIFIIAIAVVFAYPYIPGSDSRAFQGLTILAGIMVSLGSNSVVNNMVAGLFVLYRRSTNIGDRIQIGDKIGDVIEIKLMETLIKSIKNEMISIPNAQLLNSEVVNYTRKIDGRGLMLHTTVGIGYEEPQDKIEAMLIEAANRTDGLKKTPGPFVLWTQLGDFAINYQINAFTNRGSRLPLLLSALHKNIVTVFNENNVQIMTPSYEADPEEAKIPTQTWDGKLAKES